MPSWPLSYERPGVRHWFGWIGRACAQAESPTPAQPSVAGVAGKCGTKPKQGRKRRAAPVDHGPPAQEPEQPEEVVLCALDALAAARRTGCVPAPAVLAKALDVVARSPVGPKPVAEDPRRNEAADRERLPQPRPSKRGEFWSGLCSGISRRPQSFTLAT